MNQKKNIILVIIIAIVLGVLMVRQFYLQKKITQAKQPDTGEALAYQVAELIKGNDTSREQLQKLQTQFDNLQKSSSDLKTVKETLDEKNNTYSVILGTAKTNGSGVVINFDQKIASTQIVDLINALKNIGVDVISLNGKRITPTSSIVSGIFDPPIIVKAISDNNLLAESLTRPGGIISEIGFGDLQKKDNIEIDAIYQ